MDEIKEFDRKLFEINDGSLTGSRLASRILFFIGIALMSVPVQKTGRNDMGLFSLTFFADIMGMFLLLKPYLIVMEDGKVISMYRKLRYLPVNKKLLWRQRLYYITSNGAVVLVLSLCVQLLAALCAKQVTFENVCYPVAVTGAAWVVGVLYTLPFSGIFGRR